MSESKEKLYYHTDLGEKIPLAWMTLEQLEEVEFCCVWHTPDGPVAQEMLNAVLKQKRFLKSRPIECPRANA